MRISDWSSDVCSSDLWMSRDLGEGYVVSNVPEYLTRVVRGGIVIATHKAVVGKASTPTPQLNPMATGVIINPTWTLPRSIINEGIGATIANNPASARRQGYTWTGKGKKSEEHTSELQSLMRISYAVFCL